MKNKSNAKLRIRNPTLFRDERGEMYLDSIIQMLFILALIFCFLAMMPPFMAKINVDYVARSLARTIELTGAKGAEYQTELERLKLETGLEPQITVTGEFTGEKLQLRKPFTVTVTQDVLIKLMEPTFSSPLGINVSVSKTVNGRSEVYWK